MLDFDKHYGPEGWGYMESLVLKGNDPDIKELALALRGGRPPPSVIRIYLADLLEGKRKRKRGRKRADPSKGFFKEAIIGRQGIPLEARLGESIRKNKRLSRSFGKGLGGKKSFGKHIGQILLSTKVTGMSIANNFR